MGCRAALLAGAALLAAGPALADVKAGVDAWTRGEYAAAIREWQGHAAKGDADAQFNLGQAYKLGRGVRQDLARAENLFAKAAGQGHPQAADNYGLLLFQRGQRVQALPYLQGAAERGDPRAQYLLGIAHFNGDIVPKDWVRAYALASLARQAGVGQAGSALAEMDKYIPLQQRQQGATLAAQLASQANATRARQLAAADLAAAAPGTAAPARGRTVPSNPFAPTPLVASPAPPAPAPSAAQVANNARAAARAAVRTSSPAPVVTAAPAARKAPRRPVPPLVTAPSPAPAPTPAAYLPAPIVQPPPSTPVANGIWRVQLGAFTVPRNAEGMWNRVKGRPELAGYHKLLVPSGRVTKLQAGGFATSRDAQAACNRLAAAGFRCLPVRN